MDLGLKGKIAVVTGGASNIGRAIAHEYAKEDAIAVILDRDVPQGQKVRDEILKDGRKAHFYQLDVTDVEATKATIAKIEDEVGAIDILVNNVGWNDAPAFFLTFTPEHWEKEFKLNLFSTYCVTHPVLTRMVERRSGSIVNIASDAANGGKAGIAMSDYGAAKAGVVAFSRILAEEYGKQNIRVNTVSPGPTMPDAPDEVGAGSLWSQGTILTPKMLARIDSDIPLRRRSHAIDLATTTVFISSPTARQLTGQLISVSGGYVMPH